MKIVALMDEILRPIRTERDYASALQSVEAGFFAKKGSRMAELVGILSVLIEKYEEVHFPIEAPDPVEAIKFRMEQLGWTNKQLARILGGKNRVSEVMNNKRGLSLGMIKKIHKKMHIPAEVLIGG